MKSAWIGLLLLLWSSPPSWCAIGRLRPVRPHIIDIKPSLPQGRSEWAHGWYVSYSLGMSGAAPEYRRNAREIIIRMTAPNGCVFWHDSMCDDLIFAIDFTNAKKDITREATWRFLQGDEDLIPSSRFQTRGEPGIVVGLDSSGPTQFKALEVTIPITAENGPVRAWGQIIMENYHNPWDWPPFPHFTIRAGGQDLYPNSDGSPPPDWIPPRDTHLR